MWTITATQSDGAWLDDYIHDVISHAPPPLPPHDQRIGHVDTHWHQISAGVAFVAANPDTGTGEDRRLAEALVMEQLKHHGFKRAVTEMTWDHSDLQKRATWDDIEAKARRLVQSGNVMLLRNGYNTVIGQVQGDGTDNNGKPDSHRCEISRDDPESQAISGSTCDCGWGQFQNLPRTRNWKRFQNRPCSHVLATYWVSRSVPMDEDRSPGGQGQLFDMSGGQAPGSMGVMQNAPVNPNAWFMQSPETTPQSIQQGQAPLPQQQMPAQAPAPADVLPQFPMADQGAMPQVNPASVPGGRPGPTPTNPIQYPGGTFSHRTAVDQQYQNGQLIQTLAEDVGTHVGRSEEHGAGQPATIPAGAVCEVLGTDPSTGMVNVLWMGKGLDQMSYFEPFGVVAWYWPSQVTPSNRQPPGPAVRRT